MLGAMIGDIAGSKYEFNNTFDYDFEMFGEGCDFTDDTICTVAIADAILNGRSYQESLLDWCRRYPSPKGAYGGRFAGWIRSLDPQPYNSFGNGSAMRVSPVAWLFDDLSQILEEAEKTALPTHNHPEGIKREPKPWLMPSGISARVIFQRIIRSVRMRNLKNMMMRQ